MTDQFALVSVIATAIRDSRANFPDAGDGKTHDRIFQGNEDTIPFAKAVIAALDAAGYQIVPKEQK